MTFTSKYIVQEILFPSTFDKPFFLKTQVQLIHENFTLLLKVYLSLTEKRLRQSDPKEESGEGIESTKLRFEPKRQQRSKIQRSNNQSRHWKKNQTSKVNETKITAMIKKRLSERRQRRERQKVNRDLFPPV